MAKKYDKEELLREWKTGKFTQRDLAYKHKISNALVAKLTKGVSKESEQLVSNLINSKHALTKESEQNQKTINGIVSNELIRKAKAELIADRLDDALSIATEKSIKLINKKDATMQDVAQFGKFQNDARVGLDLQPKFANTTINNTNAQQTNSKTAVELFTDTINSLPS